MKTFYLFSQHAVGSLQFQKQQSLVDKLGIAENNFLIVSKWKWKSLHFSQSNVNSKKHNNPGKPIITDKTCWDNLKIKLPLVYLFGEY